MKICQIKQQRGWLHFMQANRWKMILLHFAVTQLHKWESLLCGCGVSLKRQTVKMMQNCLLNVIKNVEQLQMLMNSLFEHSEKAIFSGQCRNAVKRAICTFVVVDVFVVWKNRYSNDGYSNVTGLPFHKLVRFLVCYGFVFGFVLLIHSMVRGFESTFHFISLFRRNNKERIIKRSIDSTSTIIDIDIDSMKCCLPILLFTNFDVSIFHCRRKNALFRLTRY